MDKRIIDKIRLKIKGEVRTSESLSRHTTYAVGGEAELLVCPENGREAAWLYRFARRGGIPITIIGAGSNVIAPDEGIGGIVMCTENASAEIRFLGDGRVRAEAGAALTDLARAAAARGLGGAEPLAGIPGTVGGAVTMNAGTKERDTASITDRVEVVTSGGRRRVFTGSELSFGYRKSLFQDSGWLILGAEFLLRPGDPGEITDAIGRVCRERESKYPLDIPSAGSVFKRPPGDYAGRLIEEAGCKGLRVGGAAVSDTHANFFLNLGRAKASDILELISVVRRRVFDRSGVYLELEQIPLPVRGRVAPAPSDRRIDP